MKITINNAEQNQELESLVENYNVCREVYERLANKLIALMDVREKFLEEFALNKKDRKVALDKKAVYARKCEECEEAIGEIRRKKNTRRLSVMESSSYSIQLNTAYKVFYDRSMDAKSTQQHIERLDEIITAQEKKNRELAVHEKRLKNATKRALTNLYESAVALEEVTGEQFNAATIKKLIKAEVKELLDYEVSEIEIEKE